MSKLIKTLTLILITLLLFSSCATYTVKTGLSKIVLPSEEGKNIDTNYRVIKEKQLALEEKQKAEEDARAAEEKAKLAEEERLRAEAEAKRLEEEAIQAEKDRVASEFRKGVEIIKNRNDFPQDVSLLKTPHIFRPTTETEVLDNNFTKIDVMLIPLGNTPLEKETIDRIEASLEDIKAQFIFVTGERSNQIALARALQRKAIALDGGLIIFSSEVKDANSKSAIFSLSEEKDIELTVLSLSDKMAAADNLDIKAWQDYLKSNSEENLKAVEETIQGMSDTEKLFAFSSPEPSSLDWTIFTPYSYRSDYDWLLSDYLNKSWSDTYRSTHFSEETDGGITLSTPSISERMDFLYSQNLIEVSSDTFTLAGLSDTDKPVYALMATYLVP